MDIVVGIIIMIVAAIVGYKVFGEMWDDMQAQFDEYDEFERRRAMRQEEFDRHAQAVARAVLVDTCETIYLGRINHE